MTFEDFLQIRVMVQGYSRTLDDEGELDVFLNNMKHVDCINRVTCNKQCVVACRPRHQGSQLPETIERHMLATDSPARASTITGSRPMNRSDTGGSNTRCQTPSSTPT